MHKQVRTLTWELKLAKAKAPEGSAPPASVESGEGATWRRRWERPEQLNAAQAGAGAFGCWRCS
eukprot:4563873-Pyramimonas_sp.AAC.1